ncbi:Rieske (2Fe-2S) protein [Burkholderia sp. WSM2232]|uniref:Rieske (2Fe-2S) protein n=1 Tax=Burkholderia sp. WSM2232 TaxID=944436 RepID=UPI000A03308B|nr:Rieske 2Fe-2S domain-containing protein [Burkholderia sp. WSM2232]
MTETRLCRLDEVPDGGARVIREESMGRSIVVVRRDDKVWAYVNRCPHFSVPLEFEPGHIFCYRSQVLMCAHHSALFRFEDGRCIEGPCKGASLDTVPVKIDHDLRVVFDSVRT